MLPGMKTLTVLLAALLAAFLVGLFGARLFGAGPSAVEPRHHEDAVSAILRVLDSVPLVAIMEDHLLAEEGELYQRLLRDPRAPGRINDVIVELGNQLHQPLADRSVGWTAGPPVPADSLGMIWEDNTQAGLVTMYAPMYPAILDAVREANARVPPARRMRVLLGDPPVNWRTVTRDQLWDAHKQRGNFMRALARDSVVARGRRGVLIAGGSHLMRSPHTAHPPGSRRDAQWGSLGDSVFVVDVHVGFGAPLAALEPFMDSLPRFALLRSAGPILRDLLVNDVLAATPASDGSVPPSATPPAAMRLRDEGVRLSEVIDGYVYLGPFRSLTMSRPDVQRLRREPARLREFQRRMCLITGRPVDTTRVFAADTTRLFFPTGGRPSRVAFVPIREAQRDERAPPPPLPPELPEPCRSLLH